MVLPIRKVCMRCGSPAETKCSVCSKHGLNMYYCSEACQQSDWKAHKKICGPKYLEAVCDLQKSMNDAHRRWGPFGSIESAVRACINDPAKEIDAVITSNSAPNSANWLHLASQEGSEDATRELIAAGADVNKAEDTGGFTPLIIAAQKGYEPVVGMLIAAGADVNKTNKQGMATLHMAAQCGHEPVVRALIAAGAEIDKAGQGVTALIIALKEGHAEVVRLLIAAGADPNLAYNLCAQMVDTVGR